MNKEMTFFDLCAACGRAIGRGCAAFGRMVARMLRLTYRYWWLVLTLTLAALAAALYYSRTENLTYKVRAVALLNGPTIQQFEQAYMPLRAGQLLLSDAAVTPYLYARQAWGFTTYRVIDCLDDETPDYVDFKHKIAPTDTMQVQMKDRLCLQFRMKERDLAMLPEIEKALLDMLNADEAMRLAYATYMPNLREQVAFNHTQAQKLDSLTSCYYFYQAANVQPMNNNTNGVNFYGDRKVRLFLDEIYEQHAHLQRGDLRLQLATAPVVLENHFAVYPKPVNGRRLCVILFLLIGWAGACALAEIIDRRKAICAWLKQ